VSETKVLVACEFSGIVREAFSKRGHQAVSCDLIPSEKSEMYRDDGGIVHGMHAKEDVRFLFDSEKTMMFFPENSLRREDVPCRWDITIEHPPCDHLAVSGARWFPKKREDGRQRAAIEFFLDLWEAPISRIALENPIGIMSGKREYLKKWYPDLYERAKTLPAPQIVQPWQFGHGETKATCLWLKNLPKLEPTNIVDGRKHRVHCMAPSPNRARERARTYTGIAQAMADQWGDP
jgi:hypothetical protein